MLTIEEENDCMLDWFSQSHVMPEDFDFIPTTVMED